MYKKTLTTICFALLAFTINAKSSDFKKEFEKSYRVRSDAKLHLETLFGDVEIHTWDKNEIRILGTIRVESKSEESAEKVFDKIEIIMSGSESLVSIETQLKKCSKNGNFSIDFEINMPASCSIEGSHEFGSLSIDQIDGRVDLEMSYGDIDIYSLNHHDNEIDLEFGGGEIGFFGGGDVSISFGDLDISTINGNTKLECSYGDVDIKSISNGITKLDFSVEFGDLSMEILASSNMTIDAKSSFGDIDLSRKIDIIERDNDMLSKNIKAKLGTGNGGIISISCEFGDVDVDVE